MPLTRDGFRKIAGVCGTLTPVVAFTLILSAIASYPPFSWTNNALSDLGVVQGLTAMLFNTGLIISGILAVVFSMGLLISFRKDPFGVIGALVFTLACIALILIGVFPESVKPTHYIVSVLFFALLPISLLILTGAFALKRKAKMAAFTLLVGIVAATPWVLYYSLYYTPGVAVPEFVSGLAGTLWAVAFGYRMIWKNEL